MKLSIYKKTLDTELDKLSKGLQINSPLPALQGILFTASESNIQLITSNGNLSVKTIIETDNENKVIEPGKILIPGSMFRNIVKKQSGLINLESNRGSLTITSEGFETTLQLMNENDYPTISFDAIGKSVVADAKALEELIKNVSFAAAENDKRLILNGVNLSSKDGKLKATATNSFRLAQEEIEIDSTSEFNITILSKNLKDFIPKGVDGPLEISVNDSKIITSHQNTTYVSKLIDGVYPEVSRLIPTSFESILEVEAKHLADLVSKVTVVSEGINKPIKLTVTKDGMTIEAKRQEIGNSTIKTTNIKLEGNDVVIALNSKFIEDATQRFSGIVRLGLKGPFDPVIIKGQSNKELTQLILPQRSY